MGAMCGSSLAKKKRILEELSESPREKDQEILARGETGLTPQGHLLSSTSNNPDSIMEAGTSIEIIHKSSYSRQVSGVTPSDLLVKSYYKSRSPSRNLSIRKINLSPEETRNAQKQSSSNCKRIAEDWLSNFELESEKASYLVDPTWTPPNKRVRHISTDYSVISISPDDKSSDSDSFSIRNVKLSVPTMTSAPQKVNLDQVIIDTDDPIIKRQRSHGRVMTLSFESDKPEIAYLERKGCYRDVANWLKHFGSDVWWLNYAKVFEREKIDAISLYSLNFEDLRSLGVLEFHAIAMLTNLHPLKKTQGCQKCGNNHHSNVSSVHYQGDENNRSISRLKQQMQNLLEREREKFCNRTKELETQLSVKQLENDILKSQFDKLRSKTEGLMNQVVQVNMECHNQTQYIQELEKDLNQVVGEVGGLEMQLEAALTDRKLLWEDLQVEKQITYERRIENNKLRSLLATRNSLVPYFKHSYSEGSPIGRGYSTSSDSSGDDFDMHTLAATVERKYHEAVESKVSVFKRKAKGRSIKTSEKEWKSNDVKRDLASDQNISELASPGEYENLSGGDGFSTGQNIFNSLSMQVSNNLKSLSDHTVVSDGNIMSYNSDEKPETKKTRAQIIGDEETFTSAPNIGSNKQAIPAPLSPSQESTTSQSDSVKRPLSNGSYVSSSGSLEIETTENLVRPLILSPEILLSLTERDMALSIEESAVTNKSNGQCSNELSISTQRELSPLAETNASDSLVVHRDEDRQSLGSIPRSEKASPDSTGATLPRGKLVVERTSNSSPRVDPKILHHASRSTKWTQLPKGIPLAFPRDSLLFQDTFIGKEDTSNVSEVSVSEKNSDPGYNAVDLIRNCLTTVVDENGNIGWSDFSSNLTQYFPPNDSFLRGVFDKCSINQEISFEQFLRKVRSDNSDTFTRFRRALFNTAFVESTEVNFIQISKRSAVIKELSSSSLPIRSLTPKDLGSSFPLTNISDREHTSSKVEHSNPHKRSKSLSFVLDLKNLSSDSWDGLEVDDDFRGVNT